MALDLPLDLWLEIISHLPPSDRQKLYPVNHTLFEIIMDERYREVHFEEGREILINLKLLLSPGKARRIRTVHLCPHMIMAPPRPKKARYDDMSETAPTRKSKVDRVMKLKTAGSVERMLQIIPHMANVNELILQSTRSDEFPKFVRSLPILNAMWMSFGHSLRRLVLDITLEGCSHTLSASLTFPKLEDLSIALSHAYHTTDHIPIMRDILSPFVNNHHATLRSFELSSEEFSQYNFNAPSFLLQLQHFPRLTKLLLSYLWPSNIKHADYSALRHMFEMHSNTLQVLTLRFRNPWYPSYQGDLSKAWAVELPKLRSLDITMSYASLHDKTSKYLRQFEDTLTSLTLGDTLKQLQDIEALTNIFSGQDKLRRLELSIYTLSPKLLDLLASKLPSLEYLHLKFEWLDIEDSEHVYGLYTGELFYRSMAVHFYPNWKLRHFIAHTHNFEPDIPMCKEAIGRAIPSLQTLEIINPRAKELQMYLLL